MNRAEILSAELNERTVNPLNDVMFKFIFGKEERKQIMLDFLNAVLENSLKHEIKDIKYGQTELIPNNIDDKLTRIDIFCELDTGEQVDVEVQVANYNNMQRRTTYYWAQLYLMSLPKGLDYRELTPVITINLLAFDLLPKDSPHSEYKICELTTGHQLNNDLDIHFLEIPKFAKTNKPIEKMSKMEKWLAYFANKLNDIEREELKMSSIAIAGAMDAAEKFLASSAERRAYINRQLAIMDYNSEMRSAREQGLAKGRAEGLEKGRAEGLEKGLAEGRAEGRLSTYRALLAAGAITMDKLRSLGTLTADELTALAKEKS